LERKQHRHASGSAFQQCIQLEGFYGLTTRNHLTSGGDYQLKGEEAVVEALSSLVVAASNRTQEDWAWDIRWLQPLDEQIQYYPQAANLASASRSESMGEPTLQMTEAPGWRRLLD
jgi:hypothetical protein